MADKDVKLAIGVDISELVSGMTAAAESVQETCAAMKESLASVSNAFSMIGEAAIAVTALMAGGKIFGDMVSETVNLNAQSMELGKQFGISATQASVLKVALGETFLTQEQLGAAGSRITRTLNTNEGAFKSLGVATRDQERGFSFDARHHDRCECPETPDLQGGVRIATLKAWKIYGRGWQEVAPILRLTSESMAAAQVNAEQLNLVVTNQSEASTAAYRSAMVGLSDTFDGLKNTIGQALLPVLTSMAQWFRETGPQAIMVTRASIGTIAVMFLTVKDTVTESVDWLVGQFVTLGIQVQNQRARSSWMH